MKSMQAIRDEALRALKIVESLGVEAARVSLSYSRNYQLEMKDADIELLKQSQDAGLGLALFVDGRFGVFGTSDLRTEALKDFAREAVKMVRMTDPDPFRKLPDKQYTEPLPGEDLQIFDPALAASQKDKSKDTCLAVYRAAKNSEHVIRVESWFAESHDRSVLLTSDGFDGSRESTSVSYGGSSTVDDRDARKQVGWEGRTWRNWEDAEAPESLGEIALERALAYRGADPAKTGEYPVVIVNYWGDYFAGLLLRALDGASVYRGMSCLGDKNGATVANPVLTLTDDPFVSRGLGSRHYDDEGMVAKRMPLLDKGVLKNFYYSSYWARKQGVTPTTGSASNIVFAPGTRSAEEMIAGMDSGLFITRFIGGNFNSTSGDFSAGIAGNLIENGALGAPVSGMNIAGNLLSVLPIIEEVGNDAYPYMAIRSPSMRLGPVMISGL